MLGLTGCENGNLFGKLNDSGESNDVAVLLSDADIALSSGNYASALALYEKILDQDPDNGLALSGAAISAMAAAGLNFGTLLANIASQSSSAPGINGLSDLIAAARSGGYSSQAALPNSILAGVNLEAVDAAINEAICRLSRIASGGADASIPSNDPAMLLDLACLRLIRGVLRPVQAGYFDIVNDGGDYSIQLLADANAVCGNPANDALVVASATDIVAGYVLFARVAQIFNSGSGTITARIRDDLAGAITDGLDGGGGDNLPGACVTTINNAGITSGNFPSNTDAFQPQAGC